MAEAVMYIWKYYNKFLLLFSAISFCINEVIWPKQPSTRHIYFLSHYYFVFFFSTFLSFLFSFHFSFICSILSMSKPNANSNDNDDHYHRQRFLSLSISSSPASGNQAIDHNLNSIQLQHKLPTPISPTTTTAQHFGSLVSQFSVKPSTSNEDTNKLYTCIECGQNFNRAHNLKSHRATHSASKPYQVR